MKKLYTEEELGIMDQLYDCFTNDGVVVYTEEGEEGQDAKSELVEMGFEDLVTQTDLTRFIPETVTRIMREAIEPQMLIVPNCFQQVRMDIGQKIEIGSMGAVEAKKIPIGAEFPEFKWNYGPGDMVALAVEKYGVMISVPEEVINQNLFDVFGLFVKAAGRAIGRIQETDAVRLLNAMGIIVFDNVTPTGSQYGVCTGRDITGAQNGSMTANDIYDMYAWLMMRGFNPDTLIMSPLAWRMFMADSEMREVVLKGATLASRQAAQGGPAAAWGVSHGGKGLVTRAFGTQTTATAGQGPPSTTGKPIGANPWVTTLNPLGSTFNIAPDYLPSPLKVLVTPYISYTAGSTVGEAGRSDVVMLDSNRAGIMAVDGKGLQSDEFNDPYRDIRNMKIKAYWGHQVLEQGKGVALSMNVNIARNYVFENANSVTLSALNHTTAISNSGVSVG